MLDFNWYETEYNLKDALSFMVTIPVEFRSGELVDDSADSDIAYSLENIACNTENHVVMFTKKNEQWFLLNDDQEKKTYSTFAQVLTAMLEAELRPTLCSYSR